MFLSATPAYIFRCLDSVREGPGPNAPHLFRPETTTRFAVRQIYNPQSVEIRLSTQQVTDADDSHFCEVGRVGVLLDQRAKSGHCILIAVHSAQIKDYALHSAVADVSIHITRGLCTDMVFAPMRDLMTTVRGLRHSGVSLYATTDGGVSWQVQDVSAVLDDFLVHGDDSVTVRSGFRVGRMSVSDLLEAILFGRPALDNDQGWLIDPAAMLVHFEPPQKLSGPTIAYFDTFTTHTVVIDSTGQEWCYESEQGSLVINRRGGRDDRYPYIGIIQSGDRFFGSPMAADEIRSLSL